MDALFAFLVEMVSLGWNIVITYVLMGMHVKITDLLVAMLPRRCDNASSTTGAYHVMLASSLKMYITSSAATIQTFLLVPFWLREQRSHPAQTLFATVTHYITKGMLRWKLEGGNLDCSADALFCPPD